MKPGCGMLVALAVSMFGVSAGVAQSGTVGDSAPAKDAMVSAQDAVNPDNGAEPGDSHVRIVRLSEVKGSLSLDRKTGLGFEQTMPNMPIVEGEKLRTQQGFAEVEFEDNTTLRLAPESQVDFELLALRSSGAKASLMDVKQGIVYVNTESTKGNEFLLRAGEMKMTVAPSTHLRLEVGDTKTVLSVMNGSVEVVRDGETKTIGKKETMTVDADQVTMANKVASGPFDAWDKESNDYHARYAMANAVAGGGNRYGLSDLNYYGNFINAGGYGQIWQPYLTGAGWSPYANGMWALYPGAGYSWVSPYPWGWLPYHSGAWNYYPGYGWGWQPGGSWMGLNNIAATGFAPTGSGIASSTAAMGVVHAPTRPVGPAMAAGQPVPSMVLANQTPMAMSRQSGQGNFVFEKNSAGLGVPRGSLGDLRDVSNSVAKHGSANMPVYADAPGGFAAHGASRGPVTLRQAAPAGPSTNPGFGAAMQPGMSPSNSGMSASSPAAGSASRGGGGMSAGSGTGAGSSGGGGSGGGRGGVANSPK
jgi:Family of unknown function (DUF6600)/FecR protein